MCHVCTNQKNKNKKSREIKKNPCHKQAICKYRWTRLKAFEQTPPAVDGRALKEGGETIMGKYFNINIFHRNKAGDNIQIL